MILSLISERTVNLVQMCLSGLGFAKITWIHRRFERYLAWGGVPPLDLGKLILGLLGPVPKNGYLLAIDRTNWNFGKRKINLLVVTVIINKVGYPIYWKQLPKLTKQGNSCSKDRIKALKEVLKIIPAKDIHALLGDREFIGEQWLRWLENKDIAYIMRIKNNTLIDGQKAIDCYQRWHSGERCEVFGQSLYVSVKQLENDLLILISNHIQPKYLARLYRLRWGIEQFFSHSKTRGFNWEDSHVAKAKHIQALTGIVTLAFVISHLWGLRRHKIKPIPLKKHGRKAKSVFRYGCDDLRILLRGGQMLEPFFAEVIKFISCLTKQRTFMQFYATQENVG